MAYRLSKILRKREAATVAGISQRGLERLIRDGEGPVVTELSPGRIGISEADLAAWLKARRRVAKPAPEAAQAAA